MATESISSIRSSGGDYTTLTAWESGEQANIVTADQIAVAECYDDWASGLSDDFAIDGWTTDATRYIEIRAASGEGHTGTADTGFLLKKSHVAPLIRATSGHYVNLTDLEVYNTNTSYGTLYLYGTHIIDRCIVHGDSTTAYLLTLSNMDVIIRNSVMYSGYRIAKLGASEVASYANLYNSVFWCHNDQYVILPYSQSEVKNCYAGKASGTADDWYTNSSPTGDYNASSDSSATTEWGTTNSLANKAGSSNFVSVTSGSEDFHLSGTGVDLYNVGTDLSGSFTLDIDGDTWANWSIGADDPNPGGGGVTPIPPPLQKTDNQFATIIAHRLGGVLQ